MMKQIKKQSFFVLAFFVVFPLLILNSCSDDDDYSLDKYWIGMATVMPLGDYDYYLVLDNGTTLYPSVSAIHYRPKADQRAWVNFTLLADKVEGSSYDHLVRVNGIRNVLTKNTMDLTEENAVSIGNDYVKIHDLWIGDNYLNFYFGVNVGGERYHSINLVNNTTVEQANDGKIHLEFRHNKNDDPSRAPANGYVSFNLRPYKMEGKDITFVIKNTDFGGEDKIREIVYKLNGTSENKILEYKSVDYNSYE